MLDPAHCREGLLGETLANGSVRCHVCQVRCVIREGHRGICQTRGNSNGKLVTLIYGKASTICLDPIEKKPLFHFYPGRVFLSAGTRGCNFRCPGCQNWQVAHDAPADDASNLEDLPPAESATLAKEHRAFGLAWTYNEPVIWLEHVLEAARAARSLGLKTALVTNGYATPEALALLAPHLDAYRVDIKGFTRQAYKAVSGGFSRFEEILTVAELAKKEHGLHVECVTNVTPGINDSEDDLRATAGWIARALGPLTPWHVTRFYPHKDLMHVRPTKVERVEEARAIGFAEGLKYVYVGNLPGHAGADTHCHSCNECLIRRSAFAVQGGNLIDGKCGRCATEIPGRFEPGPLLITKGDRSRIGAEA